MAEVTWSDVEAEEARRKMKGIRGGADRDLGESIARVRSNAAEARALLAQCGFDAETAGALTIICDAGEALANVMEALHKAKVENVPALTAKLRAVLAQE